VAVVARPRVMEMFGSVLIPFCTPFRTWSKKRSWRGSHSAPDVPPPCVPWVMYRRLNGTPSTSVVLGLSTGILSHRTMASSCLTL
jgi:hypothetical protein